MVSVNSNVTTTEYEYKTPTATVSGNTSKPNSIYETNSQNTEEAANTVASEIDKILEKICEKFKQYGITPADLKRKPLIQKAYNLPAEAASKASREEKIKTIKTYVQCLEAAIKDATGKDGKLDIDKMNKLSNDYLVALSTGWTIEGFKRYNTNHEKFTLFEKLVKVGALPDGSTKENTSPEQIKNATKNFIESLVGRYNKNPDDKTIKGQLQTFGRLLINSPEDEKTMFLDIVTSLYKENKLNGLKAVFESCLTPETKKQVVKAASEPEFIKQLTSEPLYDSEGNIIQEAMSEEEATTLTKYITENQTEEIRTEAHEKYNTARQEWFEENKETLEAIQQKIDKAKADGVEPEFTEAEKQILTEQKNFINAASAGEFLGTINNNNLSKEFKESHLETLNADAYETPAYKDILQNINDYVKTHENEFSISVSKVEEFLNKATDKNYNRVATDSSEELKAPAASKPEEKADSTPDLGFSARENVNTSNLTDLKRNINTTETRPQFRVEKTTSESEITRKTDKSFKDIINNAPDCEKASIVQRLYETNAAFKSAIETFVRLSSTPTIVLNYLPAGIRADLAKDLFALGKIDEADVKKLNLSFDQNKAVLSA